ncbi:MAG TPA: 50S ribosomal protein L22 [Patescibacteria group bacterium]|nr:50S ribosomal protein L22 [Patescibacteria group bacterium]
MKVQAHLKQVRISTRKVRLVADAVRSLPLEQAVTQLPLVRKRAAMLLHDVMQSAIANAINNSHLQRENLRIADIVVNDGPALKRFHASTRGRIHPYKKRSTNITVILEEKAVKAVVAKAKEDKPAVKAEKKGAK